jgi:hypothetical protein
MNFVAWLRSKNITTHTVAALALAAAGAITFDPQVQQILVALLKGHPTLVADIVLIAGVIAKYSQSSSPSGTLANARAVKDAPNAPTSAQVDAADTAIK